ncbi:MAG: cytidyltransferase [Anaerovoracaceae bacterium]
MQIKSVNEAYKLFKECLTEKYFLRNIRMSKKAMMELLAKDDWKSHLSYLLQQESWGCADVLAIAEKTINQISPTPEEGWLEYLYDSTIGLLFPHRAANDDQEREALYGTGRLLLFQIIRALMEIKRTGNPLNYYRDFAFLTSEESKKYDSAPEYQRLLNLKEDLYIHEFMCVGAEITPYNTLGHIAGVHHLCMFIGRQLEKAGVPIDLALLSGAGFSHDLGKYGGTEDESLRIPYLHYYYTDQFLSGNHMPTIAHIATNHSTWDLELENLSVESLVLIYSDFRVKSMRNGQNREEVNFYTLKESFDVILNKLDNVDETKRDRYIKVYSKLKDFEEYIKSLGVHTDLADSFVEPPPQKDVALMRSAEVIDTFKGLAIQHNISLMSKFNNETAFGNLLEAARSEKNWKNIRAYVNIFEEYYTYMTQKQKYITLHFLYELLMHREGDIRRQAGSLMGKIIAHFDEEYRKEIPQGALPGKQDLTGIELWDRYLHDIIFPDYKVTDQHRRWVGYALRSVIISLFRGLDVKERKRYLGVLLQYCDKPMEADHEIFVVLDALLFIPMAETEPEERLKVIAFAAEVSGRESPEIKMCALRVAKYMAESDPSPQVVKFVEQVVKNNEKNNIISATYLKWNILKKIGGHEKRVAECELALSRYSDGISNVFLENLKVDTPWVVKAVNIELLLDSLKRGKTTELLHITTHLSNLLKVSEKVTVRHSAGRALLKVIEMLPLDERNEVVIELTRGLEIGEYQFSKYIPEYLGQLSLYLHPNELDEFIKELVKQTESTNDRISSVALDTVGIMISKYAEYGQRFPEEPEINRQRLERLLGILMKGLSNYREVVSQEAFEVIGRHIFGHRELTLEDKAHIFTTINKKMLTLLMDQQESELTFYNNAASLNDIYRFIKEYHFHYGEFPSQPMNKAAFFPGTFDPFSLSHKAIVREIRDMGFEVYMALDEFSWSKKTQPRMVRRKIMSMSVADERHVYLFPDSVPVNLSNERDLKRLRELLPHDDLYVVVGSDVVVSASSYKGPPSNESIHTFNHIVFRRESASEGKWEEEKLKEAYGSIKGRVVELKLPVHLEDISSTRIRENIDYNRDISNLIDNVAQNYIYDNSLYLREPQYKLIMQTKGIYMEEDTGENRLLLKEVDDVLFHNSPGLTALREYLDNKKTQIFVIRDGQQGGRMVAAGAYRSIHRTDLYSEFKDLEITAYLREHASGKIAVISCLYFAEDSQIRDLPQLLLTEVLAACLRDDYSYAVYHRRQRGPLNNKVLEVLERQGFIKAPAEEDMNIYTVDMKAPITLLQNMETTIKDPLNRDERVLAVMDKAHRNLQMALTNLYPGNLVISFNAGVMHHKIVKIVTVENQVPAEPTPERHLGPYMCVPFGKILRVAAVPNTVTKTFHTDKVFEPDIKSFHIAEYPNYSPLINQIRTIKSFNRSVILVDELLHKGYRIRGLEPLFKEEGVEIRKLVVGILSDRGKDLMTIQKLKVDSAYFIPNLRAWFMESSIYPFIGGDSVARKNRENVSMIPSINLIQPYVAPAFLKGADKKSIYNLSLTCLENAKEILKVLEEEYQVHYEKNLTLKRLGEVVISSRSPDQGDCLYYDLNLAPSVYVANDIEKLKRLRNSLV